MSVPTSLDSGQSPALPANPVWWLVIAHRLHLALLLTIPIFLLLGIALSRALLLFNPTFQEIVPADPDCDIGTGPCTSRLASGSIRLSVEPGPIPVSQPLRFQVALDGIQANRVELDFTGVGIYMGFHRFELQQSAAGRWTGTGLLSFCIYDVMPWKLTVMVHTDAGLVGAVHHFTTTAPKERPWVKFWQ